jgi:hypothetical protein
LYAIFCFCFQLQGREKEPCQKKLLQQLLQKTKEPDQSRCPQLIQVISFSLKFFSKSFPEAKVSLFKKFVADDPEKQKKTSRHQKCQLQEDFDNMLIDLQSKYFPDVDNYPSNAAQPTLTKRSKKCKYMFMGNNDIVGHMIPRAIGSGFDVHGLHYFPKEEEHEHLPEDLRVYNTLKLNPSFVQVRKESDILVFLQSGKEVAETLEHLLSMKNNFFENKGLVFIIGDAEDLVWKIVSDILKKFKILHLMIYVPQEQKVEMSKELFQTGMCYVSGDEHFYNQMLVFLTQTVASIENLTFVSEGMWKH